MLENNENNTSSTDEVDEETTDSTPTALEEEVTKWKEQAEKWKALSRKNEKALKEATAKTVDETSLEALKEELERQRAEIASYERKELIKETLKTFGLPKEAKSLLRGETEAELFEAAEQLKTLLNVKTPTPAPKIKTQGLTSGEPDHELSVEEQLAEYLKNKTTRK